VRRYSTLKIVGGELLDCFSRRGAAAGIIYDIRAVYESTVLIPRSHAIKWLYVCIRNLYSKSA